MKVALSHGLTPEEFWQMTPRELYVLTDARDDAFYRELRALSVHASWVLDPYVEDGKQLDPHDLLPPLDVIRRDDKIDQPQSVAELEQVKQAETRREKLDRLRSLGKDGQH